MASTIAAGTTVGTAIAISGDTSGALQLQTNGTTTAVTIDTSQNVGIGTTSPATKLHLLTPSATAVALRAGNSVSYAEFQVDASGYSQLLAPGGVQIFNTSGAERMRIDSSGNVGIGTSSPGAKLEVTNNQAALSYLIDTNNTTNGGSSIWRMITRNIANTGTTSVEFYKPTGTGFSVLNNDTNASNFTAFNVGSSERMRIDSSGNLLIGTTTSPAGSKELVLGGDYIEGVVATGTVGASATLSLANGTVITATLTSATACTFTMPSNVAGKSFIVLLKQPASGTATTATFTGVKYPAAGAPTITATVGKMDILTFVADGTNWYGSYAQGYTP